MGRPQHTFGMCAPEGNQPLVGAAGLLCDPLPLAESGTLLERRRAIVRLGTIRRQIRGLDQTAFDAGIERSAFHEAALPIDGEGAESWVAGQVWNSPTRESSDTVLEEDETLGTRTHVTLLNRTVRGETSEVTDAYSVQHGSCAQCERRLEFRSRLRPRKRPLGAEAESASCVKSCVSSRGSRDHGRAPFSGFTQLSDRASSNAKLHRLGCFLAPRPACGVISHTRDVRLRGARPSDSECIWSRTLEFPLEM
jgi:hypothetical protein